MPHARSAAASPAGISRRAAGGGSRTAQAAVAGRAIAWDRVGRWALLAVFVLVFVLAIGPAIGLFETVRESGQRTEQLHELQQKNRVLKERRDALNDPATLEREARRLGKVRPGERPYQIQDLPKN